MKEHSLYFFVTLSQRKEGKRKEGGIKRGKKGRERKGEKSKGGAKTGGSGPGREDGKAKVSTSHTGLLNTDSY